ncbi:MAG TPA: tetratricopeptide repeat protein [Candidatus Paceibacterota bacterium]|nr:tetratricopeptide repeat protein [Candidatus Paceibacterota bacterium]
MAPTAHSGAVAVLDGIARLALIGFVALLPIFVIPFPWASIPQSKMIFIALVALIVALIWALARLIEGKIDIPRVSLMWAVLLLPIAYAVSVAATGFTGASLVGQGIEQDTLTAVTMWYVIFALTALLFAGHSAGLRAMLRALVVGLTIFFGLQVLYIFFPTWFSLGVLQGPTANALGSWHDLGIVASLGLFLSVVLVRGGAFAGTWRIALAALGILSTFLIIVVHFTDILWGAAALLVLAWGILVRGRLHADGLPLSQAVARTIAVPLLAILFGFAAAFGTQVWGKLPAPILITEVEVRPSWQGTLDVGRQSLGAPSSLLFGTGPNSFIREWAEHKPAGVNVTPFWNADFNYGIGIIPTSVFTAGLVGTIAWSAIVLAILALGWRFASLIMRREYTGAMLPLSSRHTLFGALLVGAAYLLIFHLIYTPGPAFTSIMFVIFGLLAAVANDNPVRTVSTENMTSAIAFALLILLVVPAGFASGITAREVVSNLHVNRSAAAFRDNGNVAESGRMIEMALAISPRNDRAHRAASELGLVELSQLLANGNPETQEALTKLQETLQQTIQHGLTAVEIDDANYQNWLVLAQVYDSLAGVNVEGAYEEAQRTYERAFEANPTNPVPKLRLAQLAVVRGDNATARTHLQEALALKQNFAAAYFLLSQVEAADGNNEEAIQAAATAVQLVPNDPVGWFNLGYILYLGDVFVDAAAALEQAIARANDYANAYFFLGSAYYELGRPEDAVLAFQRVLELNPSETWLNDVINNIESGNEPFEGISQAGEQ